MKNEELMRLLARRQKRNRKLLTAGRFLIGFDFCHLGALRPIWHYK